jgi:exoribonuclease-2
MGTRPAPHAGIGVQQYAWSTSPLRRYVDLVNQWQIIATARHGRTAALAAPFKPKDAMLFAIISSFDAAYGAYNGFQAGMERFWSLRALQQQSIGELDAAVLKDGLVRADTLPLVFKATGADGLPRGSRVRVRITGIDLLTLDLHASLSQRLETPSATDAPEVGAAGDDEAEAEVAGPLAIAIDAPDEQPGDAPAADDPAAADRAAAAPGAVSPAND